MNYVFSTRHRVQKFLRRNKKQFSNTNETNTFRSTQKLRMSSPKRQTHFNIVCLAKYREPDKTSPIKSKFSLQPAIFSVVVYVNSFDISSAFISYRYNLYSLRVSRVIRHYYVVCVSSSTCLRSYVSPARSFILRSRVII